jgi:propanol-preferring alcohol dehydrogenase
VLIKIGGASVCHSDLHVMEEDLGFKPPFTLGHENAGWIAALGQGVMGFKEGDAVSVYGPWGCGRCHACQLSMENYCENWAHVDSFGAGLGLDGGMAEYMLVPSPRLLVPLGDLSPVKAAPLSDAALTPYHAIKRALPHLTADSTVVVMGVGGLGHMAMQLLRVLAPVRIVAADVDDKKLQQAKALGADDIVNNATPRKRPSGYSRSRVRAGLAWSSIALGPAHAGPGREAPRSKQRVDDRRIGRRPP